MTTMTKSSEKKHSKGIIRLEALEPPLIFNKLDEESTLLRDYIRMPIMLSANQTNKEAQDLLEKRNVECAVVCDDNKAPIGLVMKVV